jgi:uncharacterized protein (UPF0212 family)
MCKAHSSQLETLSQINLQPELNFYPEYDAGELICPNCGWEADEVYIQQYEYSHGYAPGRKNL